MKNKNIGLVVILIVLIYFGYTYWSKVKKDEWVKEVPELKYSEVRENEVWGGDLLGDDAALFYGTPLYDLAEEMSGLIVYFRSQDKIARLINELPKEYINYQEGKYGMTIGHFALSTGNFKAIQLLLDKGLNPNLIDKEGSAIIIHINGPFISRKPEAIETLKYMIKKGGDVNLYSEKGYTTPLIEAANSNFDNVKVLIEAGADPNFIVKDLEGPFRSALSSALVSSRIEIVNYLIFEQKVDFRTLKYPIDSKFHPGEYEILHKLRDMPFELNTKEYQEKMKLVAYLKTKGLNYWKTPIPDYIKTNPHYNTKEYLSKY